MNLYVEIKIYSSYNNKKNIINIFELDNNEPIGYININKNKLNEYSIRGLIRFFGQNYLLENSLNIKDIPLNPFDLIRNQDVLGITPKYLSIIKNSYYLDKINSGEKNASITAFSKNKVDIIAAFGICNFNLPECSKYIKYTNNINKLKNYNYNCKMCPKMYHTDFKNNIKVINKLLDEKLCHTIITESLDYAEKYGWKTKRHDLYPTTDNQINSNWNIYNKILEYVKNIIYKEIEIMFNLKSNELELVDLFLVKYENLEGAQSELEEHKDGSEFSFIISLNDEYTGGGTQFINLNKTYKLNKGGCIIFGGKNKHKGLKTLSGIRFILTGFINYKFRNYCRLSKNKIKIVNGNIVI